MQALFPCKLLLQIHFQMDLLVSVLLLFIDGLRFIVQHSPLLFTPIPDPNENLVIVLRELDGITNWKYLGLLLGLKDSTLTEMQANEPDTIRCKMAMLHLWLSLRDGVIGKGGATEDTLVKALYTMKENTVAHRIQTKGLISSHSPIPSSECHTTCVAPYEMYYSFSL